MTNIDNDLRQLRVPDIVELFTIDATALGAPAIYRFAAHSNPDGTDLTYGGNPYTAIPIEAEGFEVTGTGDQPTPTLRMAKVDPIIKSAVRAYRDLLGAKITRIRTFAKHLDNGSDPDGGAGWGAQLFVIDRKSNENKIFFEWSLANPLDQRDVKLPRRVATKKYCPYIYRRYNTTTSQFETAGSGTMDCPYAGTGYFDQENNAVTIDKDYCSKTVQGCTARYGNDQSLPIGVFPGIGAI